MTDIFSVTPIVVPYDAVRSVFRVGNPSIATALPITNRWNPPAAAGTGVTLTYYFSDAPPSTYTQTDHGYTNESAVAWTPFQKTTVESALAGFASVANITFQRVDSQADADLTYFLSSTITAAGFAYYPWSSAPEKGTVLGDVYFSTSWFSADLQLQNLYLAYHETGHALGLAHAFDTGNKPVIEDFGLPGGQLFSVVDQRRVPKPYYMLHANTGGYSYDTYSEGSKPTGPMLLDILALQLFYGPNMTTGGGNDAYMFAVDPNFFRTIWDAGGHDKIDLSNQVHPSLVSLVPGVYSTIGLRDPFEGYTAESKAWALEDHPDISKWNDGTNSLTIAFGAIIEDIVGSPVTDVLIGNEVANNLDGGGGNDKLSGGEGNDKLSGGKGNDILTGEMGSDTLYGEEGIDIAFFLGTKADYSVKPADSSWILTDRNPANGDDGTDTLINVERLHFTDTNVAIDMDGNAGKVARLLHAVFGPAAVQNKEYAGIGLSLLDQGLSYARLAEVAMRAAGKLTPGDIIDSLWLNVMTTPILAEQKSYFLGLLENGLAIGDLTVLAANSSQNSAQVELLGVMTQGLDYLPYGTGV
ncbi:MAG: hypothetical protein J5X22_00980 [Candidatus Accumulibacter sp.]|uniref:M10 family metallopeptidase n=1 Tax=Accumulibacter sp. TaxID=2053492 RepID=UPI001AC6B14A|nr:M10 family metallopeptidase [Accumulibacter sp.]MBN8518330.1 hypothetical protein [Accumulibacter sp.]MBO3709129.1 hypothetical protein [Accumulibacter sp.]